VGGEEKEDVKERGYHLLLNPQLPVPLAVILPPQSLLPHLPGQCCCPRRLPFLKQSPSSCLWGSSKTQTWAALTEESVSAESMKERHMQGKTRCRFALSESCLPFLQNSASVSVPLHFLLLFMLVSCPPATEHQQGDFSFCSLLCLTWVYFTEPYKAVLARRPASMWKLKQKSVKAEDFPEKLCTIL